MKHKEKFAIVEHKECTTAIGIAHILRYYAGKDTFIRVSRDKHKNITLHIQGTTVDYSLVATIKPVTGKFTYCGLDKLTYMPQVASFLFDTIEEIESISIDYCLPEDVWMS